jgi:hypothetical protein
MPTQLTLEPAGSKELSPCTCCGEITRRVWGYVHRGASTEAAYFVEWTQGKKHGANFDFIVGEWGEGAERWGRVAVSLEYRRTDRGPEFMVIDSADRSVAESELVGRALSRADVIGTPLADQVFALVDVIWVSDVRIRELTQDAA